MNKYVKELFFLGYQGQITEMLNDKITKPLIEVDANQSFRGPVYVYPAEGFGLADARTAFGSIYRSWGRYGYMGDVIVVKMIETKEGFAYFLSHMGRLSVEKPGLAADLIPIIKAGHNDYYFIGIKRKYSPGMGQPGLMGGFIDVNGYHLDTPQETVVHEAKEEIGLNIKVRNRADLMSLIPGDLEVEVDYQETKYRGELLYRGVHETGDNERMPSLGLKRVYHTTAYCLLLDMTDANLDIRKIGQWLKAGDDASSLVITHLKDAHHLKFGLKHHEEIFFSLIKDLSSSGKIMIR